MAEKRIILSVVLAVYNEQANLERCLRSVADIADEIVVVDGGSTDGTAALAKKLGALVFITDNPAMFHINKQKALDRAAGDWILQLDADEVVDAPLKQEIRHVLADKTSADAYYIPRRNYFLGDWLRKGGQYPDYVIRLFRNGKGRFPQKNVHEQIEITGSVKKLTHPMDHYSYTSVAQYWNKSAAYVRLVASDLKNQKNARSIQVAASYLLVKPVGTFFSLFIRHKGFLDGWRGLLFALFSAMHFPKAYTLYIRKAS